jgi:predicted homoserine dehydrogenase-like protein
VLTEDAGALCRSDVDVVVEATGYPDVAGASAVEGIRHGKHIVMVTVEADVLVGSVLREAADAAGVVVMAAYGDQPIEGPPRKAADRSRRASDLA